MMPVQINTKITRGWIRASKSMSARAQYKAMADAGVTAIYDADKSGLGLDVCIRSLRPGDTLGVTTADRLAGTRKAIRVALDQIRERGAVLVELKTGRRSDRADDVASMVLDAVDEIAADGRRLTRGEAQRLGKLGGEALRKALDETRLPEREARRIWRTNGNWSNMECLNHMPGWSQDAAYRHLGTRGLAKGRTRKDRG